MLEYLTLFFNEDFILLFLLAFILYGSIYLVYKWFSFKKQHKDEFLLKGEDKITDMEGKYYVSKQQERQTRARNRKQRTHK